MFLPDSKLPVDESLVLSPQSGLGYCPPLSCSSGQLQNNGALIRTTKKGPLIVGNSHLGILPQIPDQIQEARQRDS